MYVVDMLQKPNKNNCGCVTFEPVSQGNKRALVNRMTAPFFRSIEAGFCQCIVTQMSVLTTAVMNGDIFQDS